MNVLVTGATGFVAGHLVPRLLEAGHHVVAAGYDPARLARLPGAEQVVLDLRSQSIAEALPPRIDAVVHLVQANVPFPEKANDLFEVNTGSTQRLLDYARRAGAQHFVFASTGSVYAAGPRPWREDDPADGSGFYAATKLAAERLVQVYSGEFAHAILRIFWPYGPGQAGRLVPRLINQVLAGQPVTYRSAGGPRFNPLYVSDLVTILEQALALDGAHLVNVGGETIFSIREMAQIIGRETDREPVLHAVDGAATGDTVGDVSRMRGLFRLPERLTPFADGVRTILRMQNAK